MATTSSILAWKIPRTEEPGGLQSMGLKSVRHDSAMEQHPLPNPSEGQHIKHFFAWQGSRAFYNS